MSANGQGATRVSRVSMIASELISFRFFSSAPLVSLACLLPWYFDALTPCFAFHLPTLQATSGAPSIKVNVKRVPRLRKDIQQT